MRKDEKSNFYLKKSVLLRKRDWELWTMNVGDIEKPNMSIEEAMRFFKSINPGDKNGYIPDLMISRLPDGKRIFIDGDECCVSCSLVDNSRREYFLGWLGQWEHLEWKNDETAEDDVKLKDFFSTKRLGSEYSF